MNRVAAVGLMTALAMFVSVGCKKQDIAADQAAIELLVRQDTTHFAASTQHDSAGGSFVDGDTAFRVVARSADPRFGPGRIGRREW